VTAQQQFFIGIDGGGTKCKARLEDANGKVLAEAISGPANAARDLEGTLHSIYSACDALLSQLSDVTISYAQIHAGIGLAGVNIPHVKAQLLARKHPFASQVISTDLHIACLGAHNGADGAIIITGTGSSGASIVNDKCIEIGGHGFVVGDKGSGAWLGKMAVSHSLEALDGIIAPCVLSQTVLDTLGCKTAYDLVTMTLNAKPAFFAQLAPAVLHLAANKQPAAISIVSEGASYISQLARCLMQQASSRLSIIGGISGLLIPWLDSDVQATLSEAKLSPEAGAILLAKTNLTQ
jgi:glucosamine kinase